MTTPKAALPTRPSCDPVNNDWLNCFHQWQEYAGALEVRLADAGKTRRMPDEPVIFTGVCTDGTLRVEGEFVTKHANDVTRIYAAQQAAEAERIGKQLQIAELKNRGTLANNLCPDHRDKQVGKPCLACEVERLTLERDLAIAHDRQPYPTAWAYEQACKTIHQHQIRAEAAEQENERLTVAINVFATSEHNYRTEVERLRAEVAGLKVEMQAQSDRAQRYYGDNITILENALAKEKSRAAALAGELEGRWLPIETAPDDVPVLLLNRNGTMYVAEWVMDVEDDDTTHWQPLPTPPAQPD